MKRAGFTMIELIFVIVILGILSAVALPKFLGVAEQAKAGKCKAYVGTLNRTVLPALWANMTLYDKNASEAFTTTKLHAQITPPPGCGSLADIVTIVTNPDSNSSFTLYPANGGDGTTTGNGAAAFTLSGSGATVSASPIVTWAKQ